MRAVSRPSRGMDAESLVANVFRSRGWQVELLAAGMEGGPDFILKGPNQPFVVEIKALADGRADRALPLLSQAILQAKVHARKIKGAKPLAVLWVEHASSTLAKHVRAFSEQYAEGVPVGVVFGDGSRHFVGRPFEALNSESRREQRAAQMSAPQPVNLFSDLNQWMLKILLAREIPEDLLSAPRMELQRGVQLAEVAGTSAMSASRFLQQLRKEGFLDESSRDLLLVRRKELFERWRAAAMSPAPELPMRFLIRSPVRDPLREVLAQQAGEACLGLFAAAEALKFGHVSGVPAHVCVGELPRPGEKKWRTLRLATAGETPDVVLRKPPYPQTMFRGAVRREGWACSDVIQTWLDVASHPSRGIEQADLIYRKFLRKIVERESR